MNLVMILAPGFEELEAVGTADVLARLGIKVTLAGLEAGEVTGSHNMTITADCKLAELVCSDYDGVILPGGLPGATNLLESEPVISWIKEMNRNGKITAAICAAPIVLAKAGVLTDGRFTMYPGFDSYLNGLKYTDAPAEKEGNVVTGKGPGAVFAFAAKIAEAAGAGAKVEELFKGMFVREA
jgi:DJ-1 family protein